ncbi:hypothetical protein [Phreatobacter sp. AB_2022a]|uniref:hypothetical protein n=1 Tax=Phreatobacter sp. AB_2022a TaxID=3003134 RepID=UPI0022876027|nr:hypothetical protein [Phreatobacter sp. AB_2022a]MCZ0733563.1 hypothetical protein [Phreatobacter sp. AB_2022a]
MKRTLVLVTLATLAASPAFAGGRGGHSGSSGGLLNVGGIKISALNGIASGNTVNVPILNGSRNNVLNNVLNIKALNGVTGIVGGLLGGGHGCGCN